MNNRGAVKVIGIVVLVIILGVWLAVTKINHTGQRIAMESIDRLEVVWPDVMNKSVSDRAFLASLAWSCHLQDKVKTRGSTIECLQEGAENPNTNLPVDMEGRDPRVRLQIMLDDRNRLP